jgi:hypothetical protein
MKPILRPAADAAGDEQAGVFAVGDGGIAVQLVRRRLAELSA